MYRLSLVGRLRVPSEYYAGLAPPTLDFSFSQAISPPFTFTRASGATDSTWEDGADKSTYNTLANNAPLINQWGIKVEPATTNLFLNSSAPVTQTITLPLGGLYTIWMVGTGTVAVTSVTGSFSGLGSATNNVPLLINSFANNNQIQCAISGTVYRVQVEFQSSPTSYVVSTGTAGTRADSRLQATFAAGVLNVNNGTYWCEFMANAGQPGSRIMTAGSGSYTQDDNSDQITLFGSLPSKTAFYPGFTVFAPGSTQAGYLPITAAPYMTIGVVSRVACSYEPTRITMAYDYTPTQAAPINARPASLTVITLGNGGSGGATNLNGYIRGFKYWPATMSDQELHECTGPGYYRNAPVFDLDGTQANQWRMWTSAPQGGQSGTATDALMSDPPGTAYTQFATSAPRHSSRGLIITENRANFFPNSSAPAASGVTPSVGVGWGILSMRGTGSLTLTAGTGVCPQLPATVTQGNSLPIQVTTAGTFNFTCTGSVELIQLEGLNGGAVVNGFLATPGTFIKTTTGGQFSGANYFNIPLGNWGQQNAFTMFVEALVPFYLNGGMVFGNTDGTTTNYDTMGVTLVGGVVTFYGRQRIGDVDQHGANAPASVQPPQILVYHKFAYSFALNGTEQYAQDGVLGTRRAVTWSRPPGQTMMQLARVGTAFFPQTMFLRRLRYYDYAMFDDDLAALTISPPDIELSFMSGTMPAGITYARASGIASSYYDSTGVMRFAAVNTPRFDYDPVTHKLLGLLLEKTKTNYYLNSSNISLTPSDSITLTAASGIAPDSNNTMTRCVPTAANVVHYTSTAPITTTADATYTFSIFLSAQEHKLVQLYADNLGSNGFSANFDLSAGTIVRGVAVHGLTGTAITAAITYVGNNIYRCSITGIIGGTKVSARCGIIPIVNPMANFAPPFLANGTDGFLAWGGQFEGSPYPTSYMPTGATTVTRIVDQCYMTLGTWFTPIAYTMFVHYDSPATTTSNTAGGIGDTTFANAFYLNGIGASRAGIGTATSNNLSVTGTQKQIASISDIALRVCNNNGIVGLTTINNVRQTTATRMSIGGTPWALDGQIDGHMKLVSYWAKELSDNDMKLLTR